MKGIKQAIDNLNKINQKIVPTATAQAINRVAARAISRSVKRVSAETNVPQRMIRKRARLRRASVSQEVIQAKISVNRGNLPAIALGAPRMQLSKRKGLRRGGGSVLKIGRFTFKDAFIQQLNNGRWHVMQRVGESRYPIKVVKIPLSQPLTEAYTEEVEKVCQSDMGKEMASALKNQIRQQLSKLET